MEITFRIAFFIILGAMLIMRMAFSLRMRRMGERTMPDKQAIQHEGVILVAMRFFLFFGLIAILILYAINHSWVKALSFTLPGWLRWVGFSVGWLGVLLTGWSELELDRQFSPQLQLRQDHQLITSGPYGTIRHPLYTGIFTFGLSLALVSANWFFVAFFVVSLLGLGLRVPKEERMMVEQFGEDYRTYMQRTGRFLPKM